MKIQLRSYLVGVIICIGVFVLMSCASLKPEEPSLVSRIAELQESAFDARSYKYYRKLSKSRALVRNSLFDNLKYVISESDTVILFSTYDDQIGRFEGTLWTPQKSYNYATISGMPPDTLNITKGKPLYSDFIITNVLKRNWDVIQSRQKEQGSLLGGTFVQVFFIQKENEERNIDYFTFEEFFDAFPMPN